MRIEKCMRGILAAALLAGSMLMVSCGLPAASSEADTAQRDTLLQDTEGDIMNTYRSITMEEAKQIFETPGDYIIVDVRRPDEFAAGHIPGAINVVNEEIDGDPAELPDKAAVIYVYCRSGRRSKEASGKLAALGYTGIIEFGGILDWTGETEYDN